MNNARFRFVIVNNPLKRCCQINKTRVTDFDQTHREILKSEKRRFNIV